jgi:uncharacterized membrane protein
VAAAEAWAEAPAPSPLAPGLLPPCAVSAASTASGSAAEVAWPLPVAHVTSRLATLLGGRVLLDACM